EANRFLEELVAAIPVGVLSIDGQGIIRRINRAQELLSGVKVEAVLGQPVDSAFPELPPGPDTVQLASALRDALSGPTELDRTLQNARTRFIPELKVRSRVRMAHLAGAPGGGAVVIQEDLSRQAALEEELRRAERLSTVGVLAASVAHEVNNPLTTILGYAL